MALVGDLKDLNIAALIQLNCVEKNTVRLTIGTPKGPAAIYFRKGEMIEATFSGEVGEAALYRILSLKEGEFRVTPIAGLPERSIFTSWESLLLEGMRVIDETERGKARVAECIGNELDETPEVECYVIASKKGEVIATNRADDAERIAAAAILLAWKWQEFSSRTGLGEVGFSTLLTGRVLTFFMDCGGLVGAIFTRKRTVSQSLYALVDDVRRRLKYYELSHAQQEAEIVP
jgi:hypothetical protein